MIINVVDAANMQRNLYLTSQLAELGIPMVIANGNAPEILYDIVEGKPVGTRFEVKKS